MSQNFQENDRRAKGGVIAPTFDELRKIAHDNHFTLTDEECQFFYNVVASNLEAYSRVQQLPDYPKEIKYPRLPGRRPSPEENKHNAWYWRTSIKGAPNGRLHGKKVALKDSISLYGVPFMVGSGVLDGGISDEDATVVEWMLNEGAEIAGKAACEDLCIGCSVTSAPALVRNPHNPEYGAGGSSSGSAALVALGEVDMALGCDQGGSIRIPAALCGIVGLKPTYGLVPYTGIGSIDNSIDHCGPMTKNCKDAALLLSVIAGFDIDDPRQRVHVQKTDYTKFITGDIKGMKIGILKEAFGWEPESAATDKVVLDAARALTKKGAIVEEVSVPAHKEAGKIYTPILLEGAANHMFKLNGVGVGHKGRYSTGAGLYFGKSKVARGDNYSHLAKLFIINGTYMSEKYQGQFYSKAQNLAFWLRDEYNKALEKYDVLIMPTTAPVGSALPLKNQNIGDYVNESFRYHQNCCPFDITGHPAVSVPCGKINGLPVGFQIVGRHFEDGIVLKVGDALESLGLFQSSIPTPTPTPTPMNVDMNVDSKQSSSSSSSSSSSNKRPAESLEGHSKRTKQITLQERIQKLEDMDDIRTLKWKYAKFCDEQYNPELLGELFTEDAIWDAEASGFGKYSGKKAIKEFFAGVSGAITWTLHPTHNPVINIHDDGLTADATWTIIQPLTQKNDKGKDESRWIFAQYEDLYKKVDGVWKIHHCLVKINKTFAHINGWD